MAEDFPEQLGNIIIIAAPSGAGKSTLVKKILASTEAIKAAVSWTTRAMRAGEKNSLDYFFVSIEEFEKKQKANGFLEFAKVHDNYYGTPKEQVYQAINDGYDVILEIDCQGAEQVRANCGNDHLYSIFILPPSFQELETRLRQRSTDSNEVITKRLQTAKKEVAEAKKFDYLVINENLQQAELDIKHIIYANRLRLLSQQVKSNHILKDFV